MIQIFVMCCGYVNTSPYLPYDTDGGGMLKVAGIGVPKSERVWMPVSAYLIVHPKGMVLIDTGWNRRISPNGVLDKKGQIAELGRVLHFINPGYLPEGAAVDEQLSGLSVSPSQLDYVVITHLDCDHVCGVDQVADAKRIIVSKPELDAAKKFSINNHFRYQSRWWKDVNLETFDWNSTEGPFGRSHDLFGDGSVQLIHIPGHSEGLVAVKIIGSDGRYVLIDSDGAYGRKSWEQMILPGVADNRSQQAASLEWIRSQSLAPECIESLACHDPEVKPHVITLQ